MKAAAAKSLATVLATALLIAAGAGPAAAAAACPKTSVGAVESEVMCLQCGTPLAVAEDAPAAQRERAFIIGLVGQCRSKREIESALVAQYGDRVLALPRAHGFGLAAYLVPALALLAGAAAVALVARRWRHSLPRRRPAAAADAPDPAEAARLEADLDRYRM